MRTRPLETLLLKDVDAARLLGVSRSMFHLMVARGQIPRLKLGRSARYRRSDIVALIDRLAAEAEANGASRRHRLTQREGRGPLRS